MKPENVFKQVHSFIGTSVDHLCAICKRPRIYHTHEFVKGSEGEPDKRVAIQPEGGKR